VITNSGRLRLGYNDGGVTDNSGSFDAVISVTPASNSDLIGTDVTTEMSAVNSSIYVRIPFASADSADFDRLTLKMKYDAGFVAYLNGVEVARSQNVPAGAPAFNTLAENRPDAVALQYVNFDLTAHLGLLHDDALGPNVLAIHVLNASAESTDLLLSPRLIASVEIPTPLLQIYYTTDGTDPRGPDGSPQGVLFEGAFTFAESTHVLARTFLNGQWSALTETTYTVDRPIRVSEVMYNPAGDDATEFIELINIGSAAVDLTGIKITGLGDYEFLPTDGLLSLSPGARMVVVKDVAAFMAAYPNVPAASIASRPFSGSLDNGGETITLIDPGGAVIQRFRYDDKTSEGWYDETDGGGRSLVLLDATLDKSTWNDAASWRPSYFDGGSPAAPDRFPGDSNEDGVINLVDLARVQRGLTSGNAGIGDVNSDNIVNRRDLAAVLASYSRTYTVVGGGAVGGSPPAPAAVAASIDRVGGDRLLARAARVASAVRRDLGEIHRGDPSHDSLLETLSARRRRRERATAHRDFVVSAVDRALDEM
jgi:hypothetical protein